MDWTTKKVPPTGCQIFSRLIRDDCYFVDKSLFIKRLLDDARGCNVLLFTRPRRFGKTLTLDMVKTFFEAEDAQANRELFRGLQIEQAGEKYMAEQGQYPVLSISFADTKPLDAKEFEIKITAYLREVCSNFYYLLESEALTSADKNLLKMWCKLGTPLLEYTRMLGTLSQWLQKAHPQNHPVILLIDEYDTPLQVAYENKYYKKAVAFFRDFLCNGLKTNRHLRFAVLTGILRVAKESIFSGLNNFRAHTIFDTDYSDVFGFTQTEVDQLLEYYECLNKREEVKQWYDGYNFGGRQIYNPWSVLNYLRDNCKPVDYWINTSGIEPILKICANLKSEEDRLAVENLLLGKDAFGEVVDTVITYDNTLSERSVALGYLLMAGYLNARPSAGLTNRYDISVPNYEVRDACRRGILRRMREIYCVRSQVQDELPVAIIKGDKTRFQELLQAYIFKVCSYQDDTVSAEGSKQRPESFYHGVVVGLSAVMSDYYIVKSNLESGLGRSDLLFLPHPGWDLPANLPLIVMEFKKAAPDDNLEAKAREALAQIHLRKYGADLEVSRSRLLYGLAFRSKEVAIVAEEEIGKGR